MTMDFGDRDDAVAVAKPRATPEKLANFHRMLTEVCNAPFVLGDEICCEIIQRMTLVAEDTELLAFFMEQLYDRVRQMAEEQFGTSFVGKSRRSPDYRGNLNDDEDDGAWRMLLRL